MTVDATITTQVERFAEQLDAQAGHYRAVLALGAEQAAALERHDLVAFHTLLARKSTLLGEIAGLEEQNSPYRAVWEAHREDLAGPVRDRLRGVVDELRTLLEQLLEMERACEAKLAATKLDVERELTQLGRGRQALQSYQPRPTAAPTRRLDLGG